MSQKNLFFGQKVWKKLGKVWKNLETGFSEHSEISEILEIVLFRNFRKLQKNDVKLELRKSRKNLFRLENRRESLDKSSECRVLLSLSHFRLQLLKKNVWRISNAITESHSRTKKNRFVLQCHTEKLYRFKIAYKMLVFN